VEFSNDFEVSDIQSLLHHTDGVVVQDNNDTYTYPMPMYAQGKDDVLWVEFVAMKVRQIH
jgi:aspartate-semialdehyde dehydrogenase